MTECGGDRVVDAPHFDGGDFLYTIYNMYVFFGPALYLFIGFIAGGLVQPVMLNEQMDDADIAALHGNDDRALRYKAMIFTNPKVQENVRALLPVWDRNGFLD